MIADEWTDWTIDQLNSTGLFVQKVIDRWRKLPLHEQSAEVSIAFLSLPQPHRFEIGERYAALGANRAGKSNG